jgi:RHS repeat-associated protein
MENRGWYDPVKLLRVAELELPNSAYITNTYDSVARLLSTALINTGGTNLDLASYVYNTAGLRTSETNAAGDNRAYTYDNEGELKGVTAHDAGGALRTFESRTYTYDAAGNLTSKNVPPGSLRSVNYVFNTLNQIASATMGNGSASIAVSGSTTIPANSLTVNGTSVTPYADNSFYSSQSVANGLNTFTAIASDTAGDHSTNVSTVNVILTNNAYSYDLNGNLLSDGSRNFAYDDENELISVCVSNAWSNSFAYDGKMRRRIERDSTWQSGVWIVTNEIHFIYDGKVVVEERNANNNSLVSYTRGNDLNGTQQGVGGIGGLLARTTYGQEIPGAPTTAFYHADGNGNITALMYPSQQLAAKYLYDPFGNMLTMSGPLMNFNKYRFSSEEWNDNAGLYYYGYRFYDPDLQRWLNRDPIMEMGGINLYRFVANNPINYLDSFGLGGGAEPFGPYEWGFNNAPRSTPDPRVPCPDAAKAEELNNVADFLDKFAEYMDTFWPEFSGAPDVGPWNFRMPPPTTPLSDIWPPPPNIKVNTPPPPGSFDSSPVNAPPALNETLSPNISYPLGPPFYIYTWTPAP